MQPAEGVYFRREDYASFWLRALVDVIDFVVVGVVCAVLVIPLAAILEPDRLLLNLTFATCAAVAFCYFVVLKRSRFRTVGYRVGRVRIVGLDGLPASWGALTMRLGFAFLGPMNWLLDLTWLSTDWHRQALRAPVLRGFLLQLPGARGGGGAGKDCRCRAFLIDPIENFFFTSRPRPGYPIDLTSANKRVSSGVILEPVFLLSSSLSERIRQKEQLTEGAIAAAFDLGSRLLWCDGDEGHWG
jgi:uncharacterized RDD family membrane protein YckC